MYTSSKSLEAASLDELLDFAETEEPNLRQMHALEQLARRSFADITLLRTVASLIVRYVGPQSRLGGLPVGYPGAALLYRSDGAPRMALMAAIATLPFQQREDLLRWVRGDDGSPAFPSDPSPVERDILIDDLVTVELLGEALSLVLGRVPCLELIELECRPSCLALVALTLEEWRALDRRAGEVASALQAKVYLWPPDELGGLHPDLRLAVDPSGQRELVISESVPEGYHIHAFNLAA